jgi:hypothetical protein
MEHDLPLFYVLGAQQDRPQEVLRRHGNAGVDVDHYAIYRINTGALAKG